MTPQRQEVLGFLRAHVVGRTVVAQPITTRTEAGHVASAYEEDAVYSNLTETATGFSFDLITLARGTRYSQSHSGLVAEGSLNAVRALRYHMTERLSTNRLLGHARFIASTNTQPDPFEGALFLVRMSVVNGTLVVDESMVGYVDFPAADGSLRPGAVDGTYIYSLEQERLTIRYTQKRFDIDPTTLQRRATADELPAQVSHEIDFPNPHLTTV